MPATGGGAEAAVSAPSPMQPANSRLSKGQRCGKRAGAGADRGGGLGRPHGETPAMGRVRAGRRVAVRQPLYWVTPQSQPKRLIPWCRSLHGPAARAATIHRVAHSSASFPDVTEWLAQLSAAHEPPAGEPAEALLPPPGAVTDTLFGWLYNELRRAAASQLRREDAGHTLSATALAHEAWFRLSGQHRTRWENRSHFLAVASVMMRRILVNHAAARHADKRDVQLVSLTLTEAQQVGSGVSSDVLAVHQALLAFEAVDPPRGPGGGAALLRWAGKRRDCRGARPLAGHGQARLGAGQGLAAPRAERRLSGGSTRWLTRPLTCLKAAQWRKKGGLEAAAGVPISPAWRCAGRSGGGAPTAQRRPLMYESMLNFPSSLFGDFERLRRELDDAFGSPGLPSSIRSSSVRPARSRPSMWATRPTASRSLPSHPGWTPRASRWWWTAGCSPFQASVPPRRRKVRAAASTAASAPAAASSGRSACRTTWTPPRCMPATATACFR